MFLALLEHTALTTTFPRPVSVTNVQRVSIAKKDPLNLLATAIKATSALEVNQLRHQRKFSTLLHTQTVCPANVLLVITALWELLTRFRALQAISKMSLEATNANPVLKVCIVQLQDCRMWRELAPQDSFALVQLSTKSLTTIKQVESAHLDTSVSAASNSIALEELTPRPKVSQSVMYAHQVSTATIAKEL